MKLHPVLILPAFALVLAACGGSSRSGGGHGRSFGAAVQEVDSSWAADRVKVSCAGAYCRPQIGVLAYLEPMGARVAIHRCTATLIEPDKVLSSYHCVTAGNIGYFIMQNGLRKIAGVSFRAYAGKTKKGDPIVAPDAVILKLDQPVTDVTPLTLARDGRIEANELEAIVANPGKTSTEYHLDRVACRVGRHPTKFPYDLAENPDLIFGFDCRLVEGNSGSPLFAPGDDRVQAVAQMIEKDDVDGLMIAANPRCFDGAVPCVRVTAPEITRRRGADVKGDRDGVRALGQITRDTFPTEMSLGRLKLAEPLGGREAYEVNDMPRCVRPGRGPLTEVNFLDQLITIDDAGNPVEVQRRVRTGRVIAHGGRRYRIEVQWPEPFAPLAKPQEHPSRRPDLRSPLEIDLPECAR